MKGFFGKEYGGSSLWRNWFLSFITVCAAIILSKSQFQANLSIVIDNVGVPDFLIRSDAYVYALVGAGWMSGFLGIITSKKFMYFGTKLIRFSIVMIDKTFLIFCFYGSVILLDSIHRGSYPVGDMLTVFIFSMAFFVVLRIFDFSVSAR